MLSRVGDVTLPPNYFDISVKLGSLYAHIVLSALHILIHLFLQEFYVADITLPIFVQKRNWA